MKLGLRTPSPKKSLKARTTGKAKRAVKKSLDPTYGKTGAGWVKDPKKAAYNKVYNQTTKGVQDIYKQGNDSQCGNQGNEGGHPCLVAAIIAVICIIILYWLVTWLFGF